MSAAGPAVGLEADEDAAFSQAQTNLFRLGHLEQLRWAEYRIDGVDPRRGLDGTDAVSAAHFSAVSAGCASAWLHRPDDDGDPYRLFVFGFSDALPPSLGEPVRSGTGWSMAGDSGGRDAEDILWQALFNLFARKFCEAGYLQVQQSFVKLHDGAVTPLLVRPTFFEADGVVFMKAWLGKHTFRELRSSDQRSARPMDVVLAPTGTAALLLPFFSSTIDDGAGEANVVDGSHALYQPWNRACGLDLAPRLDGIPRMLPVEVDLDAEVRTSRLLEHPSRLILVPRTNASLISSARPDMRSIWFGNDSDTATRLYSSPLRESVVRPREDDDAEVPERPQKLKRSIEFDSAAQCATADMAMNPSQNGDVETVRRGSNSTSQADPATESNDRVRPTGLEERLGLPTTFPPTPIESSSEHSPPEVLIPLIDRDGTRAARPYVQPNTYRPIPLSIDPIPEQFRSRARSFMLPGGETATTTKTRTPRDCSIGRQLAPSGESTLSRRGSASEGRGRVTRPRSWLGASLASLMPQVISALGVQSPSRRPRSASAIGSAPIVDTVFPVEPGPIVDSVFPVAAPNLGESEFDADADSPEQRMDELLVRVLQQDSLVHGIHGANSSHDGSTAFWQTDSQFCGTPLSLLDIGAFYLSDQHSTDVSVREAISELHAVDEIASSLTWRLTIADDTKRRCNVSAAALLKQLHDEAPVINASASCHLPTVGVADVLEVPSIVVGQGDNWLSVSPTVVPFWELLSLHPYGDKRQAQYVVVGHPALELDIDEYMRELSHVFFSCELGTHAPFSRTSFVPARIRDDFSSDRVGSAVNESAIADAYEEACSRLAPELIKYAQRQDKPGEGQKWKQGARQESAVFVIYFIDPICQDNIDAGSDDEAQSWRKMWLHRCFAKLLDGLVDVDLQRRCIFHRLHISEVLMANGGPRVAGRPDTLRATAFSVFSKIRKEIPEPVSHVSDGFGAERYKVRPGEPERLHVPLFVLAPRSFELRWFKTDDSIHPDDVTVPFASKRHERLCRPPAARILHVAYTVSQNLRWAAIVWTDTDGVMLETAVFRLCTSAHGTVDLDGDSPDSPSACAATAGLPAVIADVLSRELWGRTMALVEATMLPWRVVICALGSISTVEVECLSAVAVTSRSSRESIAINGKDSSGVVLGYTIVALDEVRDLQVFYPDTDEKRKSPDVCVTARSRAFVQPHVFRPKVFASSSASVLATVLINTNQATLCLRSGRSRMLPEIAPRSCTLTLQVAYHAPRKTSDKDGDPYPLDSRCSRSVGRFLASQLHGLSWLSVACIANIGRTSSLPYHMTVLQRLRRQLDCLS